MDFGWCCGNSRDGQCLTCLKFNRILTPPTQGGPLIPWRPGRQDGLAEHCTPDGRLPDGDKGSDHLRDIFWRQGFNDQEIVALSGKRLCCFRTDVQNSR